MKINFKDFFQKVDQIKTPVYFFTGPEDYLKLRAKERLLSRRDFEGFSKVQLEAADLDVQTLWNGLNSPDLFSRGEIFIIDKADRLSAASKRSLLEVLDSWLEENETAPAAKILLLISQAERQDIADPLEGHLLANAAACHVFFPILTPAEAASWAKGQLTRKNIKVPEEAFGRASSQFASDLYGWANFIKNLELCLGGRTEATAQDVGHLLAGLSSKEERLMETLGETALSFLSASAPVGTLLNAALRDVENLLAVSSEAPSSLTLDVTRVFADLIYELAAAKAKVYSSRRKRDLRLASELNKAAYLWDWNAIQAFYGIVIETELDVKTGRLAPEMAVRKFLADFAETVLAFRGSGADRSGQLVRQPG